MINPTLARQLRRFGLSEDAAPDLDAWRALLASVSQTYTSTDEGLEDERDKLETIIRSLGDGVCVLDQSGTIIFINPAGAHLFGAETSGSLEGQSLSPRIEADQDLLEAIETGHAVKNDDAPFVRLDGSVFSVAYVLTPMIGRRRETAVLLFRDIAEKKRLEISLRHAQRLESIGILAAGIAHEINTPIQFVGDNISFLGSSYADLCVLIESYRGMIAENAPAEVCAAADRAYEDGDIAYVTQEAPGAIKNALDGVKRVKEIVQAMKSLAHQDRGERTTTDLNTAIMNALTVARNEYKYIADVESDLGDIPPVSCFLSDMNQVFLNLIVNAAHAIADRIANTNERGLIKIRTWTEGPMVAIALSDTGTGIKEDCRQRIFEPFFTTKEVGKGTGQGLAIARAVVVDKHKGSLSFDTELGRGTTFYVRIPIEAPCADTKKSAA
jgi:PAS domain S-box-containing protein